jgi:hypothetical protein
MTENLLVVTATSSSRGTSTSSKGSSASSGASSSPATQTPASKPTHAGTIAAGVLGGVLLIGILAALVFFIFASRKKKDMRRQRAELDANSSGKEGMHGNAMFLQGQELPAELSEERKVHEVAA